MTAPRFAPRPEPPYYAVIFTAQRTDVGAGYGETADRMVELASAQPGFIGVESTRDADGLGITVSYWRTLEDIAAWKRHLEHTAARPLSRAAVCSRWRRQAAMSSSERQYDTVMPRPSAPRVLSTPM